MRKFRMFIDGKWMDARSCETIAIMNPATGQVVGQFPRGRSDDVDLAVRAAREAFEGSWSSVQPAERSRFMYRIAEEIRAHKDELAELETLDTGKPLKQAYADTEVAARYFEYYAGAADKILGETIPVRTNILDYTIREPLGVSAQIVPWNYPIQIACRSIAPALATGNTIVVKPAEDTSMSVLALAEILRDLGLPNGVFNVVTGFGQEAGAALVSHPDINQITFTGSVETGKQIMRSAAENVVPLTLELGGKSPNIVFADANLDEALVSVMNSIIQNAGQTCSAGSRLLIEKSIHDEFVGKLVVKMKTLSIGPGNQNSDIGPIVSSKQLEKIIGYMEVARQDGLQILTGGEPPVGQALAGGNFFLPTVITGMDADHRLAQEEVFGPVLSVLTFETLEEAIHIANSTDYGLVAGIWTRDIGKAHQAASRIRAGQIFINNYGAGGGVEMPFGGYKKSGFGREKGLEALRQYTQVKNVAIKF